jgi:peptidoglycan hydrolase-like protein with peptidoglycan-binding domain
VNVSWNGAGVLVSPFARLLAAAAVAPDAMDANEALGGFPNSASAIPAPFLSSLEAHATILRAAPLRVPSLWFGIGAAAATLLTLATFRFEHSTSGSQDIDDVIPPQQDSALEARPSIGSGTPFTQAHIRYCAFQQVRLEAAGPLTYGIDLAVFAALARDWNARCSRYDYLPSDQSAVDAEVRDQRPALEAEGRALMGAWRRKLQPNVRNPADSGGMARDLGSASAGAVKDLPPLITLGHSGATETQPVSWPLLKAPALALLHEAVAARVQKRLNELGYAGPADGTWGPASRIALRHFKQTNGLLWDDVLDAETVARLFSTSAASAANAAGGRPDGMLRESAYPPPPGARLNPLNRADAESIQRRLAALGYYGRSEDGVWGSASREALRSFKSRSGLTGDDEWNAPMEQALNDARAVPAPESTSAALPERPIARLIPKGTCPSKDLCRGRSPAAEVPTSPPIPKPRPELKSAAPRPPAVIPLTSILVARDQ